MKRSLGSGKRKRRVTRRGVFRTLILLVLFSIMFYFVLWILYEGLHDEFMYMPLGEIGTTPGDLGLEYEEVTFKTQDGETLFAWYIPKENASYVVLFCHGNGGNVGHYAQNYRILHNSGFEVFPFDYRGFGKSTGEPTEKGTYLDAKAAWDYLTQERGIPPERIIIYGKSLGGPIASWLGMRVTPAALIVESSFANFVDLVDDFLFILPVGLMSDFDYPTVEYVNRSTSPVLVIHSEDDRKIQDHHGKRIYKAAPEPKEYLSINGGHRDCYYESEKKYSEGIEAFTQKHLGNPSA
jgi:alpha-beta hydrolase superfamily lysophospholipase